MPSRGLLLEDVRSQKTYPATTGFSKAWERVIDHPYRCCAAINPVSPLPVESQPPICVPCVGDDGDIDSPWDGIRPGQQMIGGLPIVGKDRSLPGRSAKTGLPRPLPSPKGPTQAERELHFLTHLPYAAWCPHCNAGKRPNSHHRRCRYSSSKPMLSADYGFFNDPGCPPICFLVIHVKPFGAIFACVVDSKGPTPKMVHIVAEFINMCGGL